MFGFVLPRLLFHVVSPGSFHQCVNPRYIRLQVNADSSLLSFKGNSTDNRIDSSVFTTVDSGGHERTLLRDFKRREHFQIAIVSSHTDVR